MQAPSIIESNRQKNWFTMDSAPYQPDQATKNILVVVQQLLNSSHDSTEFVHKILQSYESITNDRIMGEAYCLHCKGRSEPYCKNGDRLLHVFLRAKDHQGTHHPILLKEHLVFYKTFKCLKEEMRKNFGDALNEKNADGKTYGDLQFHFKDRVISSVEVSPLRMCKLIDDLIIDEHLNVLTDAQKRKKFHHFRHFLRYRAQTAYSENEHVVCEKGDTFLALAMQRHAFINSSDADAQKNIKHSSNF